MSRIIHIGSESIEFDGISLDYNSITLEQELCKSDFIQISWNDTTYRVLPAGSYIEDDYGTRYILFEPYTPVQKSEVEWEYKPQFQHPKMYLGKVPFVKTTTDSEGEYYDAIEWSYTGIAPTLMQYFCEAFNKTFLLLGIETSFSSSILGEVKASASVTFSHTDILSSLTAAANAFECEWHIDYDTETLYFGHIKYNHEELETPVLKVGENVNIPSVNNDKEYANCFIVQGSTRNMTRRVASGEHVSTNLRLTLNKEEFPNGWIDTREGDEPQVFKSLIYDDIYPHLDLYVYDVRSRTRYLLDSNGDKVISYYTDEGEPVYKTYSIWFMRLAYPTKDINGNVTKWTDYTVLESIEKLRKELQDEKELITSLMRDIEALKDVPLYYSYGYYQSAHAIISRLDIWDDISTLLGKTIAGSNVYTITPDEANSIRTNLPYQWGQMTLVGYGNGTFAEWRDDWNAYADQNGKVASLEERIAQIEEGEGTAVVVDGMTLTCSFKPNMLKNNQGELIALSSSLAGREFQLNFVETDSEAQALSAPADQEKHDSGVTVRKGDFEIIFEQENDLIIPTIAKEGLIPRGLNVTDLNTLADKNEGLKGNLVVLFNVAMTGKYKEAAQEELKNTALKDIQENFLNKKNYTVKSNPNEFYTDNPNLYIGRNVIYDDGNGYTLDTRVIKIVTNLDMEYDQTITVGNEQYKSSRTELKENVTNIISGNFTGAGMTENQVRNLLENYVAPRYLSSQDDDTAKGFISFIKGFVSKAKSLFEKGIQIGANFISGTKNSGAKVDEYGNSEFESIVIRSLLQSSDFVGDWAGQGMRIYQDENGQWNIESDSLTVRGTLRVFELLINKIKSVGGQILVSKANATIKYVETENNSYKITFEETCPFVAGDLIRCQKFTGTPKSYWVQVTRVADGCAYVSTSDEGLGNSVPASGDEVVLCGNTTDTTRQAAILISAAQEATGEPIISVLSGINSRSFNDCLRTRLGYLEDINDAALGQLSGYGLYGDNVYLRGTFMLWNGTTYVEVGKSITAAVNNLEVGGRNLLLNSDFSNENYKYYYDWNYIYNTVEHITTDLPQGFSSGVQFVAEWGGYGVYTKGDIVPKQTCYPLQAGQHYTLSFYGRVTSGTPVENNFYYGLENVITNIVSLTSEWQRFSMTFTPTQAQVGEALVFYSQTAGNYAITGLKLERGDKATDWTPSEEDKEAKIEVLSDRIKLSVKRSDLQEVGIELDGENSKIKLMADTTEVSDDLIVRRLATKPNVNGVTASVDGGIIKAEHKDSGQVAMFGINDEGQLVLQWWQDGTLICDLSPTGITTRVETKAESWTTLKPFIFLQNDAATNNGMTIDTITESGTQYYRYNAGYAKVSNVLKYVNPATGQATLDAPPEENGMVFAGNSHGGATFPDVIPDGWYRKKNLNGVYPAEIISDRYETLQVYWFEIVKYVNGKQSDNAYVWFRTDNVIAGTGKLTTKTGEYLNRSDYPNLYSYYNTIRTHEEIELRK